MPNKFYGVFVLQNPDNDEVTVSLSEMRKLFAEVRNTALSEALIAITAKLNPGGNFDREMAFTEALKVVNNLRTEQPKEDK